ncbi:hypothetical protein [Flavobacterium sp. N2270]|jgi:hypothetical protein|uniref:hypothetical protein n=1 Tax=Flavobacterium sp. N2270 TaxID=2986831 RepID=UPI002225551F|nr:hypothetical protein [Flavobacterium sp. N2270]
MYKILEEVYRINCAEAFIGEIKLIDRTLIISFSNINIFGSGNEAILNDNKGNFLDFCFAVFYDVDTITYDYEISRLLLKNRKTLGGINILTNKSEEFWICYNEGFVFLKEDCIFKNNPNTFSSKESVQILKENKISSEIINLILNNRNNR